MRGAAEDLQAHLRQVGGHRCPGTGTADSSPQRSGAGRRGGDEPLLRRTLAPSPPLSAEAGVLQGEVPLAVEPGDVNPALHDDLVAAAERRHEAAEAPASEDET